MPVYIITPKTDTLYIDKAGQSWVVTADGSITAANGYGIVNNDAYHDSVITIAGDIVADAMYKSGISSMGADAVLKVDTGGSIHAYNGLAFYGEGTYVEKLGHIIAENIGIYGNAHNMAMFNEGVIPACAAVFISTTTSASPPPEDVLITLYDLTPVEARVVLQIGKRLTAPQCAVLLDISENTLKTHLGRIFAKTDTARQTDLVRLVANVGSPIMATNSA